MSHCGHRPQLHSFPTRRSSDLVITGPGQGHAGGLAGFEMPAQTVAVPAGSPPGSIWRTARSEEHTSELQSLRHLVCRLLLEKKNVARPPGPPPRKHTYHFGYGS